MSGKHKAMVMGGLITVVGLIILGKMRMTEAAS